MSPRVVLALLALVGTTAFAPAPLPRRTREAPVLSVAQLSGDWRVVSLVGYGPGGQVSLRVEAWKRISIQNGRWAFCGSDLRPSTTYEIDIVDGRPAAIDFRQAGQKEPWMQGIIRFRGETLEVLYHPGRGKPRPTRFDDPPESFYRFELVREP